MTNPWETVTPERQAVLTSVAHRVFLLAVIAAAVLALWALSSRPASSNPSLSDNEPPTSRDFARTAQTDTG